jgi:hypothetical protein
MNIALPALACIAVVGFALAVAAVAHALRMPRARGSMIDVSLRLARWIIAALLAASAIWVVISPRADQPLLDAMERAFPAIGSAYMDEKAQAASAGAEPSTQRYRDVRRAERERNRWWIGAVVAILALSLVVSLPSRRTTPRNFEGRPGSTPP